MTEVPIELESVLRANALSPVETVEETWYAVFNDPKKIDALVAQGMPEEMADKLREPLFQAPVPAPAKRFLAWTNDNRMKPEWAPNLAASGLAILQKQTVTTTPWTIVEGQELEDIDDGRKPYGKIGV